MRTISRSGIMGYPQWTAVRRRENAGRAGPAGGDGQYCAGTPLRKLSGVSPKSTNENTGWVAVIRM